MITVKSKQLILFPEVAMPRIFFLRAASALSQKIVPPKDSSWVKRSCECFFHTFVLCPPEGTPDFSMKQSIPKPWPLLCLGVLSNLASTHPVWYKWKLRQGMGRELGAQLLEEAQNWPLFPPSIFLSVLSPSCLFIPQCMPPHRHSGQRPWRETPCRQQWPGEDCQCRLPCLWRKWCLGVVDNPAQCSLVGTRTGNVESGCRLPLGLH